MTTLPTVRAANPGPACSRRPRPISVSTSGRSYMVGDRWRDVEAGQRAGCRTVFVDRGYDEKQPVDPDTIVASLSEAEAWITSDSGRAPRAS